MGRETRTLEIPFIKGSMGGNTIALLPGNALPEEEALERVLLAIRDTHLACHECGLVWPSSPAGGLRLKIVGRSSRGFISACGGLTQVLGAAIGSGEFSRTFGFGPSGLSGLVLDTDAGPVRLAIGGTVDFPVTETDMTGFLAELRRDGIERIDLDGTAAVRAGKFLVLCADRLKGRFGEDRVQKLAPEVRSALTAMQGIFLSRYREASLDFALYDLHPERPENLGRVVFPHWLEAGHVEPACGTGTVAVCAALELERGIPRDEVVLRFESGGGPDLGGPDTTTAIIGPAGRDIDSIRFSHSRVEITSRGKVILKDTP